MSFLDVLRTCLIEMGERMILRRARERRVIFSFFFGMVGELCPGI